MPQQSLMHFLSIVPDPRLDRRKKHKLLDIMVIAVCAVLSGCDEWTEVEEYGWNKQAWLKTFLELPNGIPSHDTFGRVFSILSPEILQSAFMGWLASMREVFQREIISIDGKSLKGARHMSGDSTRAISIVSAWAHHAGLCLGIAKSELKKEEGEPRATESLIESLFLKGCIVTLDAAGATPRITAKIVEKKGDYLIGLKKNQKILLRFAETAFEKGESLPTYETQNRGHGREETRQYWQVNLKDFDFGTMSKGWEMQKKEWPHLNSFVKVKATRKVGEVTSEEVRFYMTSMKENVEEVGHAIRSHWGVENNLHWTLDVVFREDHSRARMGHAAENFSLVRRMALNMLKHHNTGKKRSIKRKRKLCGWDDKYLLETLLAQPSI